MICIRTIHWKINVKTETEIAGPKKSFQRFNIQLADKAAYAYFLFGLKLACKQIFLE